MASESTLRTSGFDGRADESTSGWWPLEWPLPAAIVLLRLAVVASKLESIGASYTGFDKLSTPLASTTGLPPVVFGFVSGALAALRCCFRRLRRLLRLWQKALKNKNGTSFLWASRKRVMAYVCCKLCG